MTRRDLFQRFMGGAAVTAVAASDSPAPNALALPAARVVKVEEFHGGIMQVHLQVDGPVETLNMSGGTLTIV